MFIGSGRLFAAVGVVGAVAADVVVVAINEAGLRLLPGSAGRGRQLEADSPRLFCCGC